MARKSLTAEQKQALATMRERMGGLSEAKKEHQKQLVAARKAIKKILAEGPTTAPRIAAALNMQPDEALWHLTGMRKYGFVSDAGEDGDYLLYALIQGDDAAAGH